MILVIDFDGVLFNDFRFKKDYILLFRRFNVSVKQYQEAYEKSKKSTGGYYTLERHLEVLEKQYPAVRKTQIKKETTLFLKKSSHYIYRDSKQFLAYWQRKKVPVFLTSTGSAFQKEKVNASGLAHFFKKQYIIKNPLKLEPLKKILKNAESEKIVFIDDKKEVVDEVKKYFPHIFVIQMMRRSSPEKSRKADYAVKNLAATQKICQKILDQK